jgi:membrane protein YdbS with pleckstrin-like domain
MTKKQFKSKIDRWLLILLVAVIVFEVIVMSIAALRTDDPGVALGLVVTALLIVALIGSLLIGTHYTVDGNTLRVVSGPFRWKVPIDQIQSVEATRSPLSSPALSLDRLRIRYGKNRQIMVSPADRRGFLKAIGQELIT